MKIPLIVFGVLLSNLVYWSRAEINCYECYTAHPVVNKNIRLCSKFGPSDEYEIRCQNSTFCMKKTTELDLPGGNKVRVVERRCAPQQSEELQWKNSGWKRMNVIDKTLYAEGCSWEQADSKAAKTQYCYCSSNYCNGGQRVIEMSLFHHTDAMSVIFIFNVVKLMRSIR